MRVLVTGASGFVGSALVPALLAAGHGVRAAGRDGARLPAGADHFVHGALDDGVDWAPALAGIDAVVHLAALAHTTGERDESRYDRINRVATEQLVAAATRAGRPRFVFVSSIRAQTGPMSERVLTEADPALPTDAYGRAKLAAEGFVLGSELPATVLRPVLVYGSGVKGNLASLLKLARLRAPLPLGGLHNARSLLSRDNLTSAIEHSLTSKNAVGETYVVADPTPISVSEIIESFRAGLGRPPGLVRLPPGLLRVMVRLALGRDGWDRIAGALVVDASKLVRHGWTPRSDTAAALRDVAASARDSSVRA